MGKILEKEKLEVEDEKENNKKNEKDKKGIEDLLTELRVKGKLSRIELLDKLKDSNLTEKDIKKWEIGLKYPDLNTIYKLSEIYKVPTDEFIKAKNTSYEKGFAGINKKIIRWFAYTLNVSFYIGAVFTVILYIVAFVLALWFFVSVAYQVKG